MSDPKPPLNLHALAGGRYRLELDESARIDRSQEPKDWCIQIPCKHGHIGVHSDKELRAYCKATRLFARLTDITSARVIQEGDKEIAIAFHPTHLDEVAELLKARRKRVVTEEELQRLASIGFKAAAPTLEAR